MRFRRRAAKRRDSPPPRASTTVPEYSPDGKYIYFNSERTGHMQIWRMKPDGSEQEQVFSDDLNNWFPHISPDGQWMVFLTYGADVTGHPENKDVMLRLMSLADKKDHRTGEAVRRAGNDQRAVVVAGQQAGGVRELHADRGGGQYEVARTVFTVRPSRQKTSPSTPALLWSLAAESDTRRHAAMPRTQLIAHHPPHQVALGGRLWCRSAEYRACW